MGPWKRQSIYLESMKAEAVIVESQATQGKIKLFYFLHDSNYFKEKKWLVSIDVQIVAWIKLWIIVCCCFSWNNSLYWEKAKLASRMLTSVTVVWRSLPKVSKFHFFDLNFVLGFVRIPGHFAFISYDCLSLRRLWLNWKSKTF